MTLKAVGFDFFGTLVDAHGDREACIISMCRHLQQCGYTVFDDDFIANYQSVIKEYRKIRYEDLQEVNNCVLVANTLKRMGINVELSDPDIISTVNTYFSPWQLTIVSDASKVLEKLSEVFKIVLVSNFSYSPFLLQSLRKLGIKKFFDHIIISDTVGWRKPHPNIFKHFLKLSKAKAEEAVYIGNELDTDILGAKRVGIKAVLFSKSSHTRNQQRQTDVFSDHIVSSLNEFEELLIVSKMR